MKLLPNVLLLVFMGFMIIALLAVGDLWATANVHRWDSKMEHVVQLAALLLGGVIGAFDKLVPDRSKEQ